MCECVQIGDVSVGIKCDANMVSDTEVDVDFDIIPNANDTFTVKYIPPAAGRFTVKVLFTDMVQSRTHKLKCLFLKSGPTCWDFGALVLFLVNLSHTGSSTEPLHRKSGSVP